ncbi:hypothetical protein QTN25_003363 [Entamoeba marina]
MLPTFSSISNGLGNDSQYPQGFQNFNITEEQESFEQQGFQQMDVKDNQYNQNMYEQQDYQQVPVKEENNGQQDMYEINEQYQIDPNVVKGYIEQLLLYYYSYDQIMLDIEKRGIPQEITSEVLQTLINQNRKYFMAYEARVVLNSQIDKFNSFIKRHYQVEATKRRQQTTSQQNQNSRQELSMNFDGFTTFHH